MNFDGAWWTSPDNVKQKMNALLDSRTTVLAGGRTARGIGFWEIGHEDLANPELTDAIKDWRAGDRSVGGIELPAPDNTLVLIEAGAAWRYLDTGVYPTPNWTARAFGDGTGCAAWLRSVTAMATKPRSSDTAPTRQTATSPPGFATLSRWPAPPLCARSRCACFATMAPWFI